eukprot:361208-Chlamydomonas_euryale.AAC.1
MLHSAYCLGLSRRPSASDMHARKCPRPEASGIYVHACPWSQADLGLGRPDRPRPAASTHFWCTDNPALVSHKSKRSGPLMHILHTHRHARTDTHAPHATLLSTQPPALLPSPAPPGRHLAQTRSSASHTHSELLTLHTGISGRNSFHIFCRESQSLQKLPFSRPKPRSTGFPATGSHTRRLLVAQHWPLMPRRAQDHVIRPNNRGFLNSKEGFQ